MREPFDPWPHPACLDEAELLKQCELGRSRTSGPGGQNRNKVETHVTVTHRPSGLEGQAGERRSQIENKRVAVRRLRLLLAVEVRTGVPIGEVGSMLWRSRRRGLKIVCNPEHADYPALLAEALDVIAAAGWDHRRAGLRLEVTPSQLLGLLRDHPPALARFNAERAGRGMRVLK